MGTNLQLAGLGPDDFGGSAFEGCNERLNTTRPDVVAGIHDAFLAVGSDAVQTNTFGAFSVVLGEYGIPDEAYDLAKAGAVIAREVASSWSTAERPRFVV